MLAAGPDGIVLDSSACYPGGGKPPDHGVLLWGGVQTRIVGARKGDDLYLIPAEDDPLPPPGTAVRTHSALHVWAAWCSGTLALVTGGNMKELTERMDFNLTEVPA